MARLLSDQEIRSRLTVLTGWKREGDFLTKTFEFESFMGGISFISRIARVAEGLQHHPDISVRYTTIKLQIQTHSAGGITSKDFQLASAIERSSRKRKVPDG